MEKYFTINKIKDILSPEEILAGNFGFEKEGLRVKNKAQLALTPHPEIFGNKLENPYITTDFSESQIEIVTPTFTSINKAYQCLSFLVDIVNTNINKDEYIWNQSLPCILPEDNKIPIAEYPGKKGKTSENYRKQLAKKYGTKKQMISGIHYNYSLNEETINKLYKTINPEISYKNFKNEAYLKITRNYHQLKWFIIYITGATPAAHETFTSECIELMDKKDNNNSYYSLESISYRNSHIGYKNLKKLYPKYDTVKNFIESITQYINEGILSEPKELYSQIRLKAKNPNKYLESLNDYGIQYVEIRSIDINPFDKCGLDKNDAEFIHIFLIYLLLKNEENYPKLQSEGLYNEELVAEHGLAKNIKLKHDKKKVKLLTWAKEIINEISQMNKTLKLGKENIINKVNKRIENPEKTYARQLTRIIENKGFIKSQLSISLNNKETSSNLIDIETIRNNKELYHYYTKSLHQNKYKTNNIGDKNYEKRSYNRQNKNGTKT